MSIEVGHEHANLVILIQKLEEAIEEHTEQLTVAEMIGAIECVKQAFLMQNLLSE